MCDHTEKVPPELRRMVCDLMPQKSLKDIRLVNQSWSQVSAALLWHTFASDLSTPVTRDFDALLTSQPGGFLDSVRILHINTAGSSSSQTETTLLQLLSLLPRGSLQKFTADHAMECRTLGVLIRRQPHLRELSSPICRFNGNKGPPGKRYVAGNLTGLRVLTIFANNSQEGYDAWFLHSPLLDTLTVSGSLGGGLSIFKPWSAEPKLKRLKSLHLDNLSFSASAGALDAWLDLRSLQTLTLRNCTRVGNFLDALATAYTVHSLSPLSSALKSISIYSAKHNQYEWIGELEGLLAIITGLEYLYASASTDQCIDIQSICCQATTLRYLVVEYLSSWDQEDDDADLIYGDTELQRLSKACSHIEELGLSCPQIDFIEWPPLEPFEWSPVAMQSQHEKKLAKFLDVIATFPKLRVLRMTQSPLDVMDDGSNGPFLERQWRYQQFGEQVLRYLAERHSSVELLAFSPTRVLHNLPSSTPDGNEHTWPHYYYLRGESETVLPREFRKKQIVAVPIKRSDIGSYMEESRILVDPGEV
ncbi:hypothetical protein DE146DRAFT_750991 [Phaeosphaeria sp. MPI-PUGE-AT-0046c]|nr:hypothetical protein DE146DRAFT_750991 [Phaeosphaeria sp. MPI-PUGE-AT-0046c]